MKKKAINYFYFIRDIPYKIPLSTKEIDCCCSGKHEALFVLLKSLGLQVRYRVCLFLWSNLNLSPKLKKIPHENDCTHTYLEIKIKRGWKVLDATWDIGLRRILPVNEWDGKLDTKIAVQPIKIFSLEKSKKIIEDQSERLFRKDLKINGKFYKAFNAWLERARVKTN
jgi:hypothetical protein